MLSTLQLQLPGLQPQHRGYEGIPATRAPYAARVPFAEGVSGELRQPRRDACSQPMRISRSRSCDAETRWSRWR